MLEGQLNEFRLGDVFQLLAWTGKSGALTIDAGGHRGRVDFSSGQISFAIANVRRAELGARLSSAGIVGEETLRRVVEAQQSGPGGVAEVLLEEGLEEQVVDETLREHIQDAVFTLLRTADGGFTFEPGDDHVDRPGPRLETEALIAEGVRRLEEWEEVRGRIPSADAVLAMTPNPPGDGVNVTVSASQWRLLVLIDGTRSVTELVELTGQGEFATSQVLAELVEAGLLDAVDPADGATGLGELLARRESLRELEESQLGMRSAAAQSALASDPEVEPASVEEAAADLALLPEPEREPESPSGPQAESLPEAQPASSWEPQPVSAWGTESVDAWETEPVDAWQPEPAPPPGVDRFQVGRELASQSFEAPPATPGHTTEEPPRRLSCDEDVTRGLLVRLMDGVRKA